MPGLSENDHGRGRPPIALIVAISIVVIAVVALHVTGVIGPGAH